MAFTLGFMRIVTILLTMNILISFSLSAQKISGSTAGQSGAILDKATIFTYYSGLKKLEVSGIDMAPLRGYTAYIIFNDRHLIDTEGKVVDDFEGALHFYNGKYYLYGTQLLQGRKPTLHFAVHYGVQLARPDDMDFRRGCAPG